MRFTQFLLLCLLFCTATAFAQSDVPRCEPVEKAKQRGESITFYIYAYQTNKFNEVLRVSPVFRVSYNFDPASGVDHSKIAVRIGREFDHFVRGIREDGTQSSFELAASTQKMGVFMCMNRDAVSEHRFQQMEAFEKWDKKVIEEEGYQFAYKFNAHYKATTQVTVDKL